MAQAIDINRMVVWQTVRVSTLQVKTASSRVLPIIITILALFDGGLHFALNYILFRRPPPGATPRPPPGAPGGPPPGGGPRFPLPLNELFILSLVGYVVLVLLFWFAPRFLGRARWIINVAMVLYVATIFYGWWSIGRPNPMGLGYLSKTVEILLVISLVAHGWSFARQRSEARVSA